MSDPAYLILNGPHRGMKQQAINGPVLRLEIRLFPVKKGRRHHEHEHQR